MSGFGGSTSHGDQQHSLLDEPPHLAFPSDSRMGRDDAFHDAIDSTDPPDQPDTTDTLLAHVTQRHKKLDHPGCANGNLVTPDRHSTSVTSDQFLKPPAANASKHDIK